MEPVRIAFDILSNRRENTTTQMCRRNIMGLVGVLMLSNTGQTRAKPAIASKASVEAPSGVRWVTLSSGYKVWTQRQGRSATKVLILNGGPELSHEYMLCFAIFLPPHGYELYFYDQLGCDQSDRPDDKSLWRLPRFVDEVDEVRSALGLDRMIVIAHSWGGFSESNIPCASPGTFALSFSRTCRQAMPTMRPM
jgi:pimeloyl-ACP methyl ester carboxylesterase